MPLPLSAYTKPIRAVRANEIVSSAAALHLIIPTCNSTAKLGPILDSVSFPLKLYLKDKEEAKGEVGRLDGDPLYNAQDMEISNFSISPPENVKGETEVTVRFKNIGKPTRIVYVLTHTGKQWKISDIRYEDGTTLRKILQADH